uniref:Secreted protein n=1 Tax=Ascaris lumbricoides TaxID=6252 RepID=A0A0M3HTZ1_ASCLU
MLLLLLLLFFLLNCRRVVFVIEVKPVAAQASEVVIKVGATNWVVLKDASYGAYNSCETTDWLQDLMESSSSAQNDYGEH